MVVAGLAVNTADAERLASLKSPSPGRRGRQSSRGEMAHGLIDRMQIGVRVVGLGLCRAAELDEKAAAILQKPFSGAELRATCAKAEPPVVGPIRYKARSIRRNPPAYGIAIATRAVGSETGRLRHRARRGRGLDDVRASRSDRGNDGWPIRLLPLHSQSCQSVAVQLPIPSHRYARSASIAPFGGVRHELVEHLSQRFGWRRR
jgi:hypothetical protein